MLVEFQVSQLYAFRTPVSQRVQNICFLLVFSIQDFITRISNFFEIENGDAAGIPKLETPRVPEKPQSQRLAGPYRPEVSTLIPTY